MIPSTFVFVRRKIFYILRNALYFRRRKTSNRKNFLKLLFLIFLIALAVYYNLSGYLYRLLVSYGYQRLFSSEKLLEPVAREDFQQYCNFPINASIMEGKFPIKSKDFKLEMVQILVRHGDRSPIYSLEGMKKKKLDCSMNPTSKDAKKLFDDFLKSLNNITTKALSANSKPHKLSSVSDSCEYNGQLTQKGFHQLLQTGQLLKKAYSNLEVKSTNNIYARSTDYDRTAQTVAALLSGFLGENSVNIGKIAINITKDTFFREDEAGSMISCPASTLSVMKSKMSKDYEKGISAMEPLMQELSDLMLVTRKSLPSISFITDYPLAYFCHGFNYPCARNGCLTETKSFQMLSYSNWHFHAKYKQFSDILSLPVLTQIGSRMLSRSRFQSPITLAIYGGHESSIIPVLQSLGTYNKRWIPYASRLVFELWSKKTNSKNADDEKYVRVLFNGEAVTQKLTFCTWHVFHELCPLKIFLDWIGGGHFENASRRYDYLCNWRSK